MNEIWPLWVTNLGLLVTFAGILITLVILYQTYNFSKVYNKKAGSGYIVGNITNTYKIFSDEIKSASPDKFKVNSSDIKYKFWKLIQECNGYVAVCKKKEHEPYIYAHIELFRSEIKKIGKNIESKDNLTYEATWSYYQILTKFHEAIKNEHDMSTRKV